MRGELGAEEGFELAIENGAEIVGEDVVVVAVAGDGAESVAVLTRDLYSALRGEPAGHVSKRLIQVSGSVQWERPPAGGGQTQSSPVEPRTCGRSACTPLVRYPTLSK